jgi:hypothetical protein
METKRMGRVSVVIQALQGGDGGRGMVEDQERVIGKVRREAACVSANPNRVTGVVTTMTTSRRHLVSI